MMEYQIQIGNISLPALLINESNGLRKYQLKPSVKLRDEARKIQVLTIGDQNEKDIRSVLLLGETGTGKTTLVNVLINNIYGVKFDQPFRLQLKDQLVEEHREQTQSQTDYITAYIIYSPKGLCQDVNYMIIDTPGFNDTRGENHEKSVMDSLTFFLLNDFGIDNLHCIGITIKSTENRELHYQKKVLSEITSVLGNDVSTITQLMVTFATEKNNADAVAKKAGINFSNKNWFDNFPIYVPHQITEDFSEKQHNNLKFRWENMNDNCAQFLQSIMNQDPISLKKTRELLKERQKVDDIMNSLKTAVMAADDVIKSLRKFKGEKQKKEEQLSKIRWKKHVKKTTTERQNVMPGYHAHNCEICNKTCIYPCKNPIWFTKRAADVAGAAAGAAVGQAAATAGIAAVETLVTAGIAAVKFVAAEAVATTGVIAGGGALVAQGLGAAASPIIAAAALPVGLGAVVMGTVVGGALIYARDYTYCEFEKDETICDIDECIHKYSEHTVSNGRLVKRSVTEVVIDDERKQHYMVNEEIDELHKYISLKTKYLEDTSNTLYAYIESLIVSTKKIRELASCTKSTDPLSLIDKLIAETREISHIKIFQMLKAAVKSRVQKSPVIQKEITRIDLNTLV